MPHTPHLLPTHAPSPAENLWGMLSPSTQQDHMQPPRGGASPGRGRWGRQGGCWPSGCGQGQSKASCVFMMLTYQILQRSVTSRSPHDRPPDCTREWSCGWGTVTEGVGASFEQERLGHPGWGRQKTVSKIPVCQMQVTGRGPGNDVCSFWMQFSQYL